MTESTPSSTTTAQPIAAGKSTAYSLLRRDVRFLGNILGEVLVHQSGKELLEIVEQIRESSKSLRAQFDNNQVEQFQEQIHKLEPAMRHQVIRAFAIYFQLVNIAEQNHRIRRKRDYERSAGETVQPGSIEDTIQGLKQEGLTPDEVQDLIKGITLELVMTAHPTEATRRVILDIHRRIAQDMMELDNPNLTHRERELLKSRLTNEVLTLWQTDEIRPRKPTVIDEVKNGLYYFDETLFTVLPDVYFELERCLVKFYPDTKWHVPTFLKFGSWIGGDRDGNPSVTSEVTWETLMMHRQLVLRKYEESLRELKKQLSFSTTLIQVTPELMQSIEKDRRLVSMKQDDLWRNANEPYRIKLTYMIEKMVHTRAATGGNPLDETIYRSPEELLQDLRIMDRSLRSHYAESVANETVARMIRQVELFGFHLMALDVRQHSKEHEAAMAEILTKMGFTDQYPSLPEASKIELLHQLLNDPRPLTSSYLSYSESTEECLNVFRTIKKAQAVMGTSCISSYLIS
ncbi:phosphoenolpyruvate carboxylase, partial [Cohnella sp.]|uniref:phosphoenolpyruvate carboxylase n=1 Tax=Cohnella sp. TaxID=1883426 RepID=UPI003565175F